MGLGSSIADEWLGFRPSGSESQAELELGLVEGGQPPGPVYFAHYTPVASGQPLVRWPLRHTDFPPMDNQQQIEIEAAAFRRLIEHLQSHTEVQNIELMLTADFCRNCLAKWYSSAAQDLGFETDYEEALKVVYGMPYADWKAKHQKEATPEQLEAFKRRQAQQAQQQ